MVHDGAHAGRAVVRRTRIEEWTKRPKWLPLLLSLLLVPLLLALLVLVFSGQSIEDKLTAASTSELDKAGISGATVAFDGRDATLSGVPEGQEDQALDAVRGVDGVRTAKLAGGGGDGEQPQPTTPAEAGKLDIGLEDGKVVLSGTVPDEETRQQVLDAAKENAGGKEVVDELTVSEGATLPGDAADTGKLVAALDPGKPGDRSVNWSGDGVSLTGAVPDEDTRKAVADGVAAALPDATVDDQMTVDDSGEQAKKDLQTKIDAYLKAHPISFEPDSAILTTEGAATVKHIAGLLKEVPDATILVEGHTAKVPGVSAQVNQKLSRSRANTVTKALVDQGITATNITAKGYGDSGPNPGRRVDIKVQ
ncbi:MAG: OmpA family protein [Micromonosporaceae bacterium]